MTTATATEAPCRVCGVATDLDVEVRYGQTPAGMRDASGDYAVGTCQVCQTLDTGTPGSAVRACLRLLGRDEAEWPAFAKVLDGMEIDASAVMFERTGSPRRGPQRKAFGHVPKDAKRLLKVAHTRLLLAGAAASVPAEPDRPTPPEPEYPQGCLACGVAASINWHGPLHTYGLTGGPDRVDGVLCDACADAYRAVGAVGLPFLEKAVMKAKGIDWAPPRLRAWVATGLDPRDEPWDWVDTAEPALTLDPWTAAMELIADLTERVEALEGARHA